MEATDAIEPMVLASINRVRNLIIVERHIHVRVYSIIRRGRGYGDPYPQSIIEDGRKTYSLQSSRGRSGSEETQVSTSRSRATDDG